ncbi:hypothetical protein FE773_01205 [Caminibacter mediatlanticus TB-2]|uniref:Uncharacterized protein n=1 Tax=Caminibacter mediatlanticus TB-2 TaxID=391592 RepID=A0ABX5V6E6_9BACT|nr:hypothetical protein [Caminibacter mediatlanticus]QCT93845.1 hypothetical protein FE773_01205 [Caminibacter mediatlanticus TB-2]
MIKRYILLLVFITHLFSADVNKLKAELIKQITIIFVKKTPYKIYINSKYFNDAKSYLDFPFVIINKCEYANICFVENFSKHYKNKIIFVTSYIEYIKHKKYIAGAFFWQKGRPTIIFNKEYINKYNIKIPNKYQSFIE